MLTKIGTSKQTEQVLTLDTKKKTGEVVLTLPVATADTVLTVTATLTAAEVGELADALKPWGSAKPSHGLQVLLVGNPVSGFTAHGPFTDETTALAYGSDCGGHDGYVMDLHAATAATWAAQHQGAETPPATAPAASKYDCIPDATMDALDEELAVASDDTLAAVYDRSRHQRRLASAVVDGVNETLDSEGMTVGEVLLKLEDRPMRDIRTIILDMLVEQLQDRPAVPQPAPLQQAVAAGELPLFKL